MKLFSIGLLAVWAAVAASTAVETDRDAIKDFETAKSGLNALDDFTKILSPSAFVDAPTPVILDMIGKAVSIISSVIGLFKKNKSAEPQLKQQLEQMAQQIREHFQQVNSRLDRISLQLDDVKNLIEWRTSRGMYSDFEIFITASSRLMEQLVASPEKELDVRTRQFVSTFQPKRLAGLKLYQAIVEMDFVISDNLAAAVVHYTQNHRRKVTSFLLAMTRLIFKGAQLEVAYEMLEHGEVAAAITQADWQTRMVKLVERVKQVDQQVVNAWHSQMQRDTQRITIEHQGLPHAQLSVFLHNTLAEKYPWREWFTAVSTGIHYVWQCGGTQVLNAPGNRHVVVASSDRATTRFNRARADAVLAAVRNVAAHVSDGNLLHEMHSRLGLDCNDAAFKGAFHLQGSPHWAADSNRVAYATIPRIKRIGIIRQTYNIILSIFG